MSPVLLRWWRASGVLVPQCDVVVAHMRELFLDMAAQVATVDPAQDPPAPAPGSHNPELFPELDSQPVPEDLRVKVEEVAQAPVRCMAVVAVVCVCVCMCFGTGGDSEDVGGDTRLRSIES
jgi:hypothetical protein